MYTSTPLSFSFLWLLGDQAGVLMPAQPALHQPSRRSLKLSPAPDFLIAIIFFLQIHCFLFMPCPQGSWCPLPPDCTELGHGYRVIALGLEELCQVDGAIAPTHKSQPHPNLSGPPTETICLVVKNNPACF